MAAGGAEVPPDGPRALGRASDGDSGESLPARVGRPPVELDNLERQRLTGLAAMGLNQELASARLGISAKTLRAIFGRDEDAALAWTLGRAEAAEEALSLLWKQARKGNPAAAIFLGKTLAGLRESGPFGDSAGPERPLLIQFAVVTGDGTARPLRNVTPDREWSSGDDATEDGGDP